MFGKRATQVGTELRPGSGYPPVLHSGGDIDQGMQSVEPQENTSQPTAYETIVAFMQPGESLQALAFSDPGGLNAIPESLLDHVLTPFEAARYMQSWSILGGYGNVSSYAMLAWTNLRVIWVTQSDGQTTLHAAPITPPAFGSVFRCDMPGG